MTLEGLTIAAMLISVIISIAMGIGLTYLYLKTHRIHIAIWSFALYFMGLRVLIYLLGAVTFIHIPNSVHFTNDVLLIMVDVLWIYGIFHFLEYATEKKRILIYGFVGCVMLLSILFTLNTPGSILAGEGFTLVIIHPSLLSYLFWIFYRSGREVDSPAMRYLGIAFLLWAADFIIFGIPYFVYKDPLAGALGWTIGLTFRLMLAYGLIEMRKEAMEIEGTNPPAGKASR